MASMLALPNNRSRPAARRTKRVRRTPPKKEDSRLTIQGVCCRTCSIPPKNLGGPYFFLFPGVRRRASVRRCRCSCPRCPRRTIIIGTIMPLLLLLLQLIILLQIISILLQIILVVLMILPLRTTRWCRPPQSRRAKSQSRVTGAQVSCGCKKRVGSQ